MTPGQDCFHERGDMAKNQNDRNPYVMLRKRCGMTQKDFAAKYDFSKITMVYLEAGMYPEVSDRMNEALATECALKGIDAQGELLVAYGVGTLGEAYELWKADARAEAAPKFWVGPPFTYTRKHSPFWSYMIDTCGSVQAFCKTLKVPAASAGRYADGTTKSMPAVIEDALRFINFGYLDELIEAQDEWWEANRG